jgi:hypothetical protein
VKLPEPKSALDQLPFITSPVRAMADIGNPETGVLSFPIYNDLSVTEAAWVAANGANKQAFSFTSKLALRIAREQKVPPIVGHNFVAKVLASAIAGTYNFNEQENNWAVEYADALEQTSLDVLDVSINACVILTTCLIKHRLPNMGHWTPEMTRTLPNALVEAIYAFGLKEQAHGKETDPQQAASELIEALGKSSPGPGKTRRTRTGPKFTGASETSIPATPSSPESDSETSDPPTSSTP